MAQIGDTFRTGKRAPVSGVYEFERCIDSTPHNPTAEERQIPLSKGEVFPPLKSVNKGVIWKLVRRA